MLTLNGVKLKETEVDHYYKVNPDEVIMTQMWNAFVSPWRSLLCNNDRQSVQLSHLQYMATK